jgi:hypothetical protein
LATIKNIGAYLSIGGGIICGIAAFFTSFLFFIGLAIGLIVGMGMIISNNKKKKIVIDNIQNQKTIVLEAWQQMCNEYRNLRDLYKLFDSISEKIVYEIAKI